MKAELASLVKMSHFHNTALSNLGRTMSHPYSLPNRKTSKTSSEIVPMQTSEQLELDTFEVVINRNSLGLGFSISGGLGAPAPFSNQIMIKKIFPLQPAWQSGRLQSGDIILKAGGLPLTGLNLRQALDILRSGPASTKLLVHRPTPSIQINDPDNVSGRQRTSVCRSYSYTPATQPHPLSLLSVTDNGPMLDNNQNDVKKYGEFSIELRKVNGSLGFTLCRGAAEHEHSVLRHTVRALVKEPAKSDGRILPGDKLIAANGVECDKLSHTELIAFLRQCPEQVKLTLYRDASRSQTPVSPEPLRRPSAFMSVSAGNLSRPKQLR